MPWYPLLPGMMSATARLPSVHGGARRIQHGFGLVGPFSATIGIRSRVPIMHRASILLRQHGVHSCHRHAVSSDDGETT
jgi:hypothetical protein